MDLKTQHSIVVCTKCRGISEQSTVRLQHAIRDLAAAVLVEPFEVGSIRCMAGCDRPLTVGFSAPGKASYLFGDIEPDSDAVHLIAFAKLYASIPNGWCNEGQRPPGLAGKIIARIPSLRCPP